MHTSRTTASGRTSGRTGDLGTRPSGDDGFTLVEALVSALVLMLFASGVFGIIGTTVSTSKLDRQRAAASSLAQREVEIARSLVNRSRTSALALVTAGTVDNPNPVGAASGDSVVDGVRYRVVRSARWEPRGTGTSSCDGGSRILWPNIHVTATVSWAGSSARPVVSDTLIAPPKGVLSSGTAFVAVKVVDFATAVVPGRRVTATAPSGAALVQTTDSSGCALFALTTTGTHTVSLDEPGWVDLAGNQLSSRPWTVDAGTFTSVSMTYERAARLDVDLAAPAGFALPSSPVAVSLYNARFPAPTYTRSWPTSGGTVGITPLAPWSDGFVVFPGGCSDANPTGPPTGASRPPLVLAPGASVRTPTTLAPVEVVFSSPVAGLTATAVSQSTCPAGQGTLTLGSTDAGGRLRTSLPYGAWTVQLSNGRTSAVFNPPASGAATTVLVP